MPSYRESHLTKGADYDESFHAIPHRAMMWRLEQRALGSILTKQAAPVVQRYLDFACGTGRVLAYVAPYAEQVVGVDISPAMLEVAHKHAPSAELICGDLTREPLLQGRMFDVVSAFRFFPNAEDDLRRDVITQLVRHLKPRGLLIFNNHRNPDSLIRRIDRARGRIEPEPLGSRLMSHEEVSRLVGHAGLRIVRVIPLGTVPVDEARFYGPRALIESTERVLSSIPAMRPLAQNAIYACKHL